MVTRINHWRLHWRVSCLVFGLLCFALTALAQEPDAGEVLQAESGAQTPASLPADRIIDILRNQPGLMVTIKKSVVALLQEQGRPVAESQLSDAVLFDQIQNNAKVRAVLTEELRKRGYLDGEELVTQSSEAPRPQLRRRTGSGRDEPARPAIQPKEEPNQPEVSRRPSPYQELPSLSDLYSQIPSNETTLRQFGSEIFNTQEESNDNLPIDLPVGPDYVLGPGDDLNIDIWGSISQRLQRVVDPQGQIALPEAGTVVLTGQTLGEAQKLIASTLSKQYKDVKVDVSLARVRTVRVYVVGDVEHPGAYNISSLSTPLNALYAAGGPTQRGTLRAVRHYRGRQLIREIDLYEFLLQGVRSAVERLEPGDTILVPPIGSQVTVSGLVRRPAIYELKNEKALKDVLELAGGVLVSASLQQIRVERIEAHQKRVMLSFNISNTTDQEGLDKAFGQFQVQDGDRINISPILPYSEKTVYLEGHVIRPGKYPYSNGMTVADLVRSYKDLLPEPAERAEIIRLMGPDFHPQVIEFKLSEVLTGDDPIELQPFDTLRILGRYEYDAPKVSIYGEVLRPGEYPLAQDMKISDLVRLAGGFKRSALRVTADLTSYVVQNGEKIVTENSVVALEPAFSGDPKADLSLKPGDVLTIRQLSGWNDIGAAITLSGEVQHPGTYGIQEAEKLSSVLKRAGGFSDNAYPYGAVLERDQVRELDQKSRATLIQRIESAQPTVRTDSPKEQSDIISSFAQQQQQILSRLKAQPPTGRLVIKISSDISRWENTPADIEVRSGDVLIIPKRPSFILVNGQVNSPSAVSFTPGRSAGWYLSRAGGVTEFGNKKEIFIVRADGSVVGREGISDWWNGGVLSTILKPGDTVVVPEKIVTQSAFWKNLLNTAQITSSLAIAAKVATSF